MSYAETAGPFLVIDASMTCFPKRMSLLGVLLIMWFICGVKSQKNLPLESMNRHFQVKLADRGGWLFAVCRWIAFLPVAGEMLSVGSSVRLGRHYL